MSERICFAGLDVHARRTAGAAVQLGSGEVFKAQISGPPVDAIEWLQTLPGLVRAVYEAGPTGFGLARAARAAGIEMMVCAPGAIPRQPGDQIKTDTRDALKLARLLAAGQLRPVVVPEPELEALRDLVRCREDLSGDLMACRHRITKLLLRRGLTYPGPGAAWTRRHASWLGSLTFNEPLLQLTFAEHLSCHEVLLARRDRLDRLIAEQATTGPWAALIARLRCLRGVDTLTAIGLLTEVGDFAAFPHPRHLASFVGLVPSESSSGDRRRQGSITKCGSSHARRLLIEAAWHYRRHPALSVDLRRRKPNNQPPRSTPPGAPSSDSTGAGPTSTTPAARSEPPSLSPSPANSPALCGRSPTNPPNQPAHPARDEGGGRRAQTGIRDHAMSTDYNSARSMLDSGPSATNSPS